MLFKKKRLLADHEAAWIAAQFAWFADQLSESGWSRRELVLPTSDFFSVPKGSDHGTACAVFEQVKSHMGLGDDWPCRLEAQEPAHVPHAVADAVMVQTDETPINGTFRMTETGALITYDPALMTAPKAYITTVAHELAHYVILSCPAQAEWEEQPMLEEMVTDPFVIAAGFGIFKLESISQSTAFQSPLAQGWSVSHAGYISREFAAMAMAIFLRTNNIDPGCVTQHVSRHSEKLLKRALQQLEADSNLLEIAKGNVHPS
ncbi:hypothetical protein [Aliiroseovarius marinus]|uniref:hypothetical protein n=1 Tax=Aliiroseovarius marinus TaxID=2500159 RepID=UPI002495254F|nr:hypothetical protein [Aliiroseovarius marinus]